MRRKMFCVLSAILLMTSTAYGQEITKGVRIECGMGAKIGEGDIFVPLRVVADAIGARTEWEAPKASVTLDGTKAEYIPESGEVIKNGVGVELSASAYIEDDRMFVPLSSVEDVFVVSAEYDENGVTIYYNGERPYGVTLENHNANFAVAPVSWNGEKFDGSDKALWQAIWDDEVTTNIYRPQPGETFTFGFNGPVPDEVTVKSGYLTYNEDEFVLEEIPVTVEGGRYSFSNQPIQEYDELHASGVYVIEAAWGENVCRYAFITDNKFAYTAYEDLAGRMKELKAIDYCVVGDYVYYVVFGDEEGFHRMLIDGRDDVRIRDFDGIKTPLSGSTAIRLEPMDGYLLCEITPMREYQADGSLSGPFASEYVRIDIQDEPPGENPDCGNRTLRLRHTVIYL